MPVRIQEKLTELFLACGCSLDDFKRFMLKTHNVRISEYKSPESKQSVYSAIYANDKKYGDMHVCAEVSSS